MGLSGTTALERRRRKRRRAKLEAALPAAAVVRALSTKPSTKRWAIAIGQPSWKLLGLAGVAGVAATGAVVARNRRAHRDVEPDELRERLHERLGAIGDEPREQPPDASA
ncbi:MAG: hypothetical protein QOJ89_3880 [bacterium]|jgi:hypothetical protein